MSAYLEKCACRGFEAVVSGKACLNKRQHAIEIKMVDANTSTHFEKRIRSVSVVKRKLDSNRNE